MPPNTIRTIGTDPVAFEAFYREHIDAVQRFVARRVGDVHTAADLTADIFLTVIEVSADYVPARGRPVAWLFGIARHVVADHYRQAAADERARARIQGRALLDEDAMVRAEERIAAAQDARALYASLATLPDADRALLELVALDGLTITDAARVLGVKPGTARVRLLRARRQITTHVRLTTLEVTS